MNVTVVVPAFNAEATIIPAVRSVIDQTRPPDQIVVVDDGSTDGTASAVESHFGANVTLIRQENRGVAEARNRGVSESTGAYLQFLDADDMLLPTKLAQSLELCETSQAAVVYGPAQYVGPDGATPLEMEFPPLPSGRILTEWLTGTMANGTYGVASSMFVRRDALLDVGPFEKSCTPCEDWDMWIRLAARHSFAALHKPLVVYRVVPGSLSRHALNMAKGRLNVVRRVRALPEVQEALDHKTLDRLEAGRWHVYAIRLWEAGRRVEARQAFTAANALAPSRVRRLYSALSYALPAKSTVLVERMVQLKVEKT